MIDHGHVKKYLRTNMVLLHEEIRANTHPHELTDNAERAQDVFKFVVLNLVSLYHRMPL